MTDDRAALERALAADPADRPTHAAYADMLAETGDPRGDYVRLQLSLEDRTQPVETLRAMEQEAFALRQAHEAEWLGPLAVFVNPATGMRRRDVNIDVLEANVQVTYRRGWIDTIRVRNLTPEVVTAIAACPIVRLASAFTVESGVMAEETLLAMPNLTRLHVTFNEYVGLSEDASWFHPLTRRNRAAPFSPESLPRLRQLAIHSPGIDDDGVTWLVRSGLIDQLSDLDLSDCAITDDGAATLANSPAVHRLDTLELAGNHISPVGIDLLAVVGVAVSQRQRLGPPGDPDADADGDTDAAGVEW